MDRNEIKRQFCATYLIMGGIAVFSCIISSWEIVDILSIIVNAITPSTITFIAILSTDDKYFKENKSKITYLSVILILISSVYMIFVSYSERIEINTIDECTDSIIGNLNKDELVVFVLAVISIILPIIASIIVLKSPKAVHDAYKCNYVGMSCDGQICSTRRYNKEV